MCVNINVHISGALLIAGSTVMLAQFKIGTRKPTSYSKATPLTIWETAMVNSVTKIVLTAPLLINAHLHGAPSFEGAGLESISIYYILYPHLLQRLYMHPLLADTEILYFIYIKMSIVLRRKV